MTVARAIVLVLDDAGHALGEVLAATDTPARGTVTAAVLTTRR
jgi:hypothetical protein